MEILIKSENKSTYELQNKKPFLNFDSAALPHTFIFYDRYRFHIDAQNDQAAEKRIQKLRESGGIVYLNFHNETLVMLTRTHLIVSYDL